MKKKIFLSEKPDFVSLKELDEALSVLTSNMDCDISTSVVVNYILRKSWDNKIYELDSYSVYKKTNSLIMEFSLMNLVKEEKAEIFIDEDGEFCFKAKEKNE